MDVLVENYLFQEARKLFDEMPLTDVCSCNTLMSGFFRNGEYRQTLILFISMLRNSDLHPNSISFSCAMKASGALGSPPELAFQLHGLVTKFSFLFDATIKNSILDMYVKCGFIDHATRQFDSIENPTVFCWNSLIFGLSRYSLTFERARELFHRMPQRNIVSWNTMISSLHQHGHRMEALSMFSEMNSQVFRPDAVTYEIILRVCAAIPDEKLGRHLHARVIKLSSTQDVYLGGALVNMYAKTGDLVAARKIFDGLIEADLASWTSIISGFAQSGNVKNATDLFNQMRHMLFSPDEINLSAVLGACLSKDQSNLGIQLHALSIKMGFDSSTAVANALTLMYARTGRFNDARIIFSSMPSRNVVSWTTMVMFYGHTGNLVEALLTFREMPTRNVAAWNAILASFMQNDRVEEGFKMYMSMLREEESLPDSITFTILFSACADLGMLCLGSQLFSQGIRFGVDCDLSVANALVNFYAKCGIIEEAVKIFDFISRKNLVSWNIMISGYAQNGMGRKAIEAFKSILMTGINPDRVTFIGLLSACRHSGLVEEGKYYFDSMLKNHDILPGNEHIACMVDLLGRSGRLGEAKMVIDDMEGDLTPEIWVALLSNCRLT